MNYSKYVNHIYVYIHMDIDILHEGLMGIRYLVNLGELPPHRFSVWPHSRPVAPWALCPSGWVPQSLRHLTWTGSTAAMDRPSAIGHQPTAPHWDVHSQTHKGHCHGHPCWGSILAITQNAATSSERCSHRESKRCPLEWLPPGRSNESAPGHVKFQDTSSYIHLVNRLGTKQLTDFWYITGLFELRLGLNNV